MQIVFRSLLQRIPRIDGNGNVDGEKKQNYVVPSAYLPHVMSRHFVSVIQMQAQACVHGDVHVQNYILCLYHLQPAGLRTTVLKAWLTQL